MTTRRVGATWFSSPVSFNDFVNAPHGYYSIDGGPDIDMGELTSTTYQSEPNTVPGPEYGQTKTLYQGSVNPVIPAGAVGLNVVFKIYDPVNINDVLEYSAIDVCAADATTVVISPSSATVATGRTRQFTAEFYAADGLPTNTHGTPVWSATTSGPTEGSINTSTGLFTAGTAAGGPYVITVTAGLITDDAAVTVIEVSATRVPIIAKNHNCGVLI